MIGLDGAGRDQHARTMLLGFGNEEFQLAGFVAAKGQARLVVTLHENARSAQYAGKTRQFLDWSRQMG
jgi:hypothetical protein